VSNLKERGSKKLEKRNRKKIFTCLSVGDAPKGFFADEKETILEVRNEKLLV